MYDKQPAYHPKSYNRLGHGSGRSCLSSLIYKFILTVLIIVGIFIFLFWLIIRPKFVKLHVTDASLTEFNYIATNNTLHYDTSVKISVYNPNKWINIDYNYIEATTLYHNVKFDTYSFDRFYQYRQTTAVLRHAFKGQRVVVLGTEATKVLDEEKRLGVYQVNVKMYLKMRFKLGMYKFMMLKHKVTCKLHVPFNSTGAVGSNFKVTKCG